MSAQDIERLELISSKAAKIVALNLSPRAGLRLYDLPDDKFEAALAEAREMKAMVPAAQSYVGDKYDVAAFVDECLEDGAPMSNFRAEVLRVGAEDDVHISTTRAARPSAETVYAARSAQIDALRGASNGQR